MNPRKKHAHLKSKPSIGVAKRIAGMGAALWGGPKPAKMQARYR